MPTRLCLKFTRLDQLGLGAERGYDGTMAQCMVPTLLGRYAVGQVPFRIQASAARGVRICEPAALHLVLRVVLRGKTVKRIGAVRC